MPLLMMNQHSTMLEAMADTATVQMDIKVDTARMVEGVDITTVVAVAVEEEVVVMVVAETVIIMGITTTMETIIIIISNIKISITRKLHTVDMAVNRITWDTVSILVRPPQQEAEGDMVLQQWIHTICNPLINQLAFQVKTTLIHPLLHTS